MESERAIKKDKSGRHNSLKNYNVPPFEELTKTLSDEILLEIGKALGSSDFTVRWYNNKDHPGFYKNRANLETAIRRIWCIGAFNHRDRIIQILKDHEIIEDNYEE